jgi:hypothetical protein
MFFPRRCNRTLSLIGCQAVLSADHELHHFVLPECAPRGKADGAEQIGNTAAQFPVAALIFFP